MELEVRAHSGARVLREGGGRWRRRRRQRRRRRVRQAVAARMLALAAWRPGHTECTQRMTPCHHIACLAFPADRLSAVVLVGRATEDDALQLPLLCLVSPSALHLPLCHRLSTTMMGGARSPAEVLAVHAAPCFTPCATQAFSDDEGLRRDTTAAQLADGKDIQGIPWELTQYSREGYRVCAMPGGARAVAAGLLLRKLGAGLAQPGRVPGACGRQGCRAALYSARGCWGAWCSAAQAGAQRRLRNRGCTTGCVAVVTLRPPSASHPVQTCRRYATSSTPITTTWRRR